MSGIENAYRNTESPGTEVNPLLPSAEVKPRIINPMNWSVTDTAKVAAVSGCPKITGPTARYPSAPTAEDLAGITAKLNLERGIIETDADKNVFYVPGTEMMFPLGVFHLYEYDFYYDSIRVNVLKRLSEYLQH